MTDGFPHNKSVMRKAFPYNNVIMKNHRTVSIYICHFTSIGIPIIKIRRSHDRLSFVKGIPIQVRWYLFIESAFLFSLQWRHNRRDRVSNHQPHDCLLNRLFRHRSKKTSKLRVTGLCVGNSPGAGEFPAQMASNAENVSIWWRYHDLLDSTLAISRNGMSPLYTNCPRRDQSMPPFLATNETWSQLDMGSSL